MKIRALLYVLLFVIISQINAQQEFVPGYLLTSPVDTVFGFIKNNSYYTNSRLCEFKINETDTSKWYYPQDLYGYRFKSGKFYISKNVLIDSVEIRLFMEYLIKGKLDIYFCQDHDFSNHYFASKDTISLKELEYSDKIIDKDGAHLRWEKKSYIGPLMIMTSDCEKIREEIPEINEPNHVKLIRFAERYHEFVCEDENCIIYEKKLPKKKLIRVQTPGIYYMFNNDFISNVDRLTYGYGASFLFQQSQSSENIYLGFGINYVPGLEALLFDDFEIPVSIHYLSQKQGLSPVLGYEFDLNDGFILQAPEVGLNYRINRISISFSSKLKTKFIVVPIGFSAYFGLNYYLN